MTFKEQIIAGAVGGLLTSIAIPLTSYFIVRLLNKFLVCIEIDERDESNYKVYNIKVRNRSLATLKNVIAHISIDNNKNDLIPNSRIKTFGDKAKIEKALLSWSKNIDNKNLPQTDINQGESPDINLIRYHFIDPSSAIEIASELGFYDEQSNNKSRALLTANHNYIINIVITGENFWPKKKTFIFNYTSKELIKK